MYVLNYRYSLATKLLRSIISHVVYEHWQINVVIALTTRIGSTSQFIR